MLWSAQFRAFIHGKSKSVDVQLDSVVSGQFEVNRAKLVPILEAIILCGRQQNIALGGNHDDSKYFDGADSNCGNLQAILSNFVRCGNNKLFKEHIKHA